jgi:lipoprotein-anchoring transpeptidase ErfK/SrfK
VPTSLSILYTALALLKPLPALAPAAKAPVVQPAPARHLLVRVETTVPVLTRPGGARLATVGSTTQFGSARVLSVVGRSGRWLHVATADLPTGRNGWLDRTQPGLAIHSTRLSIVVHLGQRRLDLLRDDQVVRSAPVGIGAPGSPTPVGRFAVTDKLAGSAFSPVYGCCILALSAQQTHLPAGWHGGNRIAIHGTNVPSSIGAAVSTGCLHADKADLRYLMARVPLGTPVTVER